MLSTCKIYFRIFYYYTKKSPPDVLCEGFFKLIFRASVKKEKGAPPQLDRVFITPYIILVKMPYADNIIWGVFSNRGWNNLYRVDDVVLRRRQNFSDWQYMVSPLTRLSMLVYKVPKCLPNRNGTHALIFYQTDFVFLQKSFNILPASLNHAVPSISDANIRTKLFH